MHGVQVVERDTEKGSLEQELPEDPAGCREVSQQREVEAGRRRMFQTWGEKQPRGQTRLPSLHPGPGDGHRNLTRGWRCRPRPGLGRPYSTLQHFGGYRSPHEKICTEE